MVQEILKLGNPQLYEVSIPVTTEEQPKVHKWVSDLHDTLMEYRKKHGAGRAIAAPQIGVKKRLIYMHIDSPHVFINPSLSFLNEEKYTLLDDCMSFPGLIVKVLRYKRVSIKYQDMNFQMKEEHYDGDLSELLQHEYDHLDGILATMRAVDNKSLIMEQMKRNFH